MASLNRALARDLDSDRQFFARHPMRRYRLRAIFESEREFAERAGGPVPAETFVVIEQVCPGVRIRLGRLGSPDLRTEWSDQAIELMLSNVGGHA